MLNLTEIAARIKQPDISVASDIDSLRTLCDTYPYAQIFPLLYLKTLAQTNDVRLESELQKFAFRISNRTVLFDLLHEIEQVKPANDNTLTETTDATTIAEQLPTSDNSAENEQGNSAPVEIQLDLEQNDSELVAEKKNEATIAVAETSTDAIQEVENNESKNEEQLDELPSIEDELLLSLNIPNEVYSLEAEELKNIEENKQENQDEQKVDAPLDLEVEKQKLIAALTASKPLIPNQPIEEEKEEQQTNTQIAEGNSGPRSFTSWLKSTNTNTVESQPTISHKEQLSKVDPKQLIDRFIQTEPKISPAKEKLFEDRTDKKELYNPTKKAKESLDETQLPVSETLAKIFAAQGNYPKAISAYQQLMLIFPEKKVFFASQIEDLNKKLNT